jgi:3-dehydroquinate synthase
MEKIAVNLPADKYQILIGSGLLTGLGGHLLELGLCDKAVVITNPVVRHHYGKIIEESLDAAGFKTIILEVPDGEEQKSLQQAGQLYECLSEIEAERKTPVLALGGGVIGDLAGFVAATYMRGVPLVQLPTSLLAQVDSSVGGKVAVNHGKLKNNIGVFYQPRLVTADISTLKTLPAAESENGLAEVIKYGIIRDPELFKLIELNIGKIKSADEKLLEDMVSRCVSIKVGVVEQDEKDLGLRNILNFGHTVGHALEAVSDFRIPHGQAVAIGMLAAGRISWTVGLLNEVDVSRIKSIIKKPGLPVTIPGLDVGRIMQAMEHDKKKVGGKLRFVLLRAIGEALISDEVSAEVVEKVLKDLL